MQEIEFYSGQEDEKIEKLKNKLKDYQIEAIHLIDEAQVDKESNNSLSKKTKTCLDESLMDFVRSSVSFLVGSLFLIPLLDGSYQSSQVYTNFFYSSSMIFSGFFMFLGLCHFLGSAKNSLDYLKLRKKINKLTKIKQEVDKILRENPEIKNQQAQSFINFLYFNLFAKEKDEKKINKNLAFYNNKRRNTSRLRVPAPLFKTDLNKNFIRRV